MSGEVEVVEYRGYKIHVFHDQGAECLQESADCEPPVVAACYDLCETVRQYGGDSTLLKSGLPDDSVLTDATVRQHWREILWLSGWRPEVGNVRSNVSLTWRDLRRWWCSGEASTGAWGVYSLVDGLRNSLEDSLSDEAAGDRFDDLARVWSWCGVVALSTSTTGYCQGDYADLLIVATPSFLARTGAVVEKSEDLKGSKDVFTAWLWGDVYGYTVTKTCPCCDGDTDTLEGCWGFYGSNREDSGLMGAARDAIDSMIEQESHEHQHA